MLFASFLGCLGSVARLKDSATAGNIQKMNSHLTIGQVKRCLGQLEKEGYVEYTIARHGRTGKKVFNLTNICATNMLIVSKAIDIATDEYEVENA